MRCFFGTLLVLVAGSVFSQPVVTHRLEVYDAREAGRLDRWEPDEELPFSLVATLPAPIIEELFARVREAGAGRMNTDWMPGRRSDRLSMARVWLSELPKTDGAWSVSEAEVAELRYLTEDLQSAMDQAVFDAGSKVLGARARDADAALTQYMRRLHRFKFFTPPMNDADWRRLGLAPRDTIRTSHVNVPEVVSFSLDICGIRQVHVRFRVSGHTSAAKPKYYPGAVIAWGILDRPPANPDDLAGYTLASRTPHTLMFDEQDRGKTVYIALRWQNARGRTGSWSDIKSTVVP